MKGKWFTIFFALTVLFVTGKALAGEANAYINRGDDYFKKEQYDLAIADYTKAIEIDPKDASAYTNRGNNYIKNGEYDLAIADYTKAIEIGPKNAIAYRNWGIAYGQKGEHIRALAEFIKANEIDPKIWSTTTEGLVRNKRDNSERQN